MSGLRTITDDDDLLDNVHPGSIPREDFLIGSKISLDEKEPVDANIDLRLARYFGMSEGFFLGLQIDFDLEQERRAHGDELAKITRRAA